MMFLAVRLFPHGQHVKFELNRSHVYADAVTCFNWVCLFLKKVSAKQLVTPSVKV